MLTLDFLVIVSFAINVISVDLNVIVIYYLCYNLAGVILGYFESCHLCLRVFVSRISQKVKCRFSVG